MKILHVIASMNPKTGGVCQAVRTMAKGLEEMDVRNEVVSLDDPEDAFLAIDTLIIHALGPAKGPWAYSDKLKPWLVKNIEDFDSIIVHGLWLYPSYIAAKCLKQIRNKNKSFKTKLFVMPHGMLDPYFQKASGRKIKALRNKIYWQLIESKVINGANGLLFTCEEEKLLARKSFTPYRPKMESVIGLGVENPPSFNISMRDAFLQKCSNIDHYILFLGRIHEKKGVDLLVKAYILQVDNWKKTGENFIPKLVIAGPGLDTQFGQQLKRIVKSGAGIEELIIFPGMLEGDAKWGAFYGCDAFVLPSHQENFGIAVVEALACGKPVLISNQVNIWREIKQSGAGIIADDTELGAIGLLSQFKTMDNNQIKTMQIATVDCYEKNFAIGPAANKLLATLQ